MWINIARFILRNRIAILVALFLVTAFMGIMSRRIEMSYQYAPLLPEDDPTYVEYQEFLSIYGNEGNMVIVGVQNEDFFELNDFNAWQEFSESLLEIKGVTSVFSVGQSYNLKKNTKEKHFEISPIFPNKVNYQTELDSLKNVFYSLPFYKELLYNDNQDAFLLAISLDDDILHSKKRVKLVSEIQEVGQQFVEKHKRELHFSGLPYIRVVTAEMIKRELNMFIFLALGITALIIFLFFRSFKVVMFSMLVVGIAVIWALGIQAMFGYKITILTGMIPPLIIVIGIPNSVFLLNKYHQEYRKHQNKIKALQRVIRKIGNATFLTNLTTASGFATFIFTSSKILVEFGVIAAINIMVVFILSILLIPIIFSFLDGPKERHLNHLDNKLIGNAVNGLVKISLNHRTKVYWVAGTMLVLGIIGIANIKTTGYMLDDIPHHDPLYVDLKFFEENFNGLMPLELMIDTKKPNGAISGSNLKRMDKLQEELKEFDAISHPLSMVEVVKFARQAFYNGKESHYKVPSMQERNFILSYVNRSNAEGAADNGLITTFIDSTKQRARLSFRMKDVGTTEMAILDEKIRETITKVFPSEKYYTSLTGASVVFFKGTDYLVRNLFTSLLLAVILIASFMAWMFSSKRMVLVSLIPNIFPLIMTAALMGFFNIPIKPSTILVFSIAFGISVDDTIHYLAKYRQELSETNWSIRAAVVLALKETGVSMIYTSIILFFGFGIFSVSQFGGTVALGILVAITLLIALCSNLILLPSLLLTLEKSITNQSFKEPLLHIYDEDEDIELEELKIENKKQLKSE
ncbi:RND family transporter [Carboxylicivirga sp. M1479]|uniref:efflux RND transporter permease subunit n=1 Tax=Carboxylicivirga sp. M1479 TaxID=2594476 RepID=UPI00117843AF|nr:MMPL family transporter [Carboxylicivirga sp. M1479]TRX71624.1 MMPL family transporter [Carboxylicivirga sp. M1479]